MELANVCRTFFSVFNIPVSTSSGSKSKIEPKFSVFITLKPPTTPTVYRAADFLTGIVDQPHDRCLC